MYTPFDFNEAIGHKKDYIEENLREGSPVVGMAYDGGLLLLTVRRSQRKVYEIYDRQMFSAIGKQADIENIRLISIQNTHEEGFNRSPDDVSLQRLVGFYLSPALKNAFGDQWKAPFVIRALFAESGRTPEQDVFFTINYDGEFREHRRVAVIAGTQRAEDRMLERLGESETLPTRDEALQKALMAWAVGAREALKGGSKITRNDDEDDLNPLRDLDESEADSVFLRDELKTAQVEVGLLERRTNRESRFRLLHEEIKPLLALAE
jgi:proteasome alpha subunit